MPSVLVGRPLPEPVIEHLRNAFEVEVRTETLPMTDAEMIGALERHDAILPTLGDRFTAEIFAAASPLRAKILANFGVGYNHIDVAAARDHGVSVTNTPGAVTDATADIAMTLILMTCRRAGEGERMVRAGNWPGWHPTQLLGLHVTGKTLGIVGMGRIGKAIARRAHFGFGMEILFHNRSRVEDPGVPSRQVEGLSELMEASDIIAIAVPGGAGTRHLVDAAALAAMKAEGYLVNIARGDVIDEAALIAALQDGRIAGAGLDVYEHEPHVPEALKAMENVTLLPHLGTSALEVRISMGQMAADNLIAWAEGKELPNPV
ncbi:2-hydroxyacid dehydrogenase [Ovoidimarina sediminis]|uniref:2-hydroxyacid dehydrogenase n=1 Tax=Ovoidimarina sediminis TaxID=3079856 RepID=UPI00290D168E|nr:D-glycerate dehydrogenase [Rhodophyticola sp. MJ-SS7]MDU8943000.1 D-glycerate dehydrogenase [Rhodophyticola sp. MJ-SS7]